MPKAVRLRVKPKGYIVVPANVWVKISPDLTQKRYEAVLADMVKPFPVLTEAPAWTKPKHQYDVNPAIKWGEFLILKEPRRAHHDA